MENPEHVDILRLGVEIWNEWRVQNPETVPDLSNVTLIDDDLSGADLHNVNLHQADLRGTILRQANLRNANLSYVDLREADLQEADLSEADMKGVDLSEANLSKTVLRAVDLSFGAHLHEVNLSEADLYRADLRGADLFRANLHGANLTRANLSGTNLSWADLSAADLSDADFRWAWMSGAVLLNAICDSTTFMDIDLSNVYGLQTVEHRSPSYIDINTLYKSRGKIPQIFLRGCGVPENLIQHLPSLTSNPPPFHACFISYSHADKSFARRLYNTLQELGVRCWLDEKDAKPGSAVYGPLHPGRQYWDKVLLCCSKDALSERWWVDREIEFAIRRENDLMEDRGQRIVPLIPLDLDGHLFSLEYENAKMQYFRSRVVGDFKGWEHDNAIFEREIERVFKALRTDGENEPPPEPRL
jgi:uncharacterized protein YjbI with pentapeptide repeats